MDWTYCAKLLILFLLLLSFSGGNHASAGEFYKTVPRNAQNLYDEVLEELSNITQIINDQDHRYNFDYPIGKIELVTTKNYGSCYNDIVISYRDIEFS